MTYRFNEDTKHWDKEIETITRQQRRKEEKDCIKRQQTAMKYIQKATKDGFLFVPYED